MKRGMAMAAILMGLGTVDLVGPGSNVLAQESGWVSLFDGKTMSGWTMVELPGREGKSNWEFKDGMICGSGEASMLYSPKGDYRNFKFKAELMINDGGNSGMYFRTAKKPSFSDGYEAQVNATHRDPIKTGSVYTMVHLYKAPHKANEFFTQEIEVVDKPYRGKVITSIKVSVNGELLYEFQDFERTFKEGHFAFQQHDPGSKVCIRKIEVMPLPDTPAR